MTAHPHTAHLLLAAALVAAGAPAPARAAAGDIPSLYHVPPAEAPPGPLVVSAVIERGWEGTLELRYRRVGATAWQAAPFQLQSEDRYIATVPAHAVQPPGFDYYVAGTTRDGTRRLHFASERDPHRVLVHADRETVRRERELGRLHGRRARVRVAYETVDFGDRDGFDADAPATAFADRYYRIDADLTYRLLRFPLYSLRFGFTTLQGETLKLGETGAACDPDAATNECTAGIRAGGWFELRFRLGSSVDLDGRAMVVATPGGFNVGSRGELRLGPELGSHVALAAEWIGDVGSAVSFSLGWDTVPRLPMAATIELSDFPDPGRPAAVRLLFDVAHAFDFGLRAGLRVGYQARDQEIGGLTAGTSLALDF